MLTHELLSRGLRDHPIRQAHWLTRRKCFEAAREGVRQGRQRSGRSRHDPAGLWTMRSKCGPLANICAKPN